MLGANSGSWHIRILIPANCSSTVQVRMESVAKLARTDDTTSNTTPTFDVRFANDVDTNGMRCERRNDGEAAQSLVLARTLLTPARPGVILS
jgi:hypothetical protein